MQCEEVLVIVSKGDNMTGRYVIGEVALPLCKRYIKISYFL